MSLSFNENIYGFLYASQIFTFNIYDLYHEQSENQNKLLHMDWIGTVVEHNILDLHVASSILIGATVSINKWPWASCLPQSSEMQVRKQVEVSMFLPLLCPTILETLGRESNPDWLRASPRT